MKADTVQAREEMLHRLAENADFVAWLGSVIEEFCGFEQGYHEVDPFRQGIRAAASWMMTDLARVEPGRKALATMYINHNEFAASRRDRTNEENEDGRDA